MNAINKPVSTDINHSCMFPHPGTHPHLFCPTIRHMASWTSAKAPLRHPKSAFVCCHYSPVTSTSSAGISPARGCRLIVDVFCFCRWLLLQASPAHHAMLLSSPPTRSWRPCSASLVTVTSAILRTCPPSAQRARFADAPTIFLIRFSPASARSLYFCVTPSVFPCTR